ncbi:Coiled-coil domain-containing protein 13 [Globomyces sp. JEL0801]|nr:Coiled-coil domain-containing protein 13 [Globomyces sp. JEL0801]
MSIDSTSNTRHGIKLQKLSGIVRKSNNKKFEGTFEVLPQNLSDSSDDDSISKSMINSIGLEFDAMNIETPKVLSLSKPCSSTTLLDSEDEDGSRNMQLESANPLSIVPQFNEDSTNDKLQIQQLKKQIGVRDSEIKSLQNNGETSNIDGVDYKNSRIFDLAKKSRRLTVQYEKEKSKNFVLVNRIKELESKSKSQINEPDKSKEPNSPNTNGCSKSSTIKTLKDRLALSTRKLEEERIQNQTLKTDIRNLQKVLNQEIGEGYSVEKLLKGESNWKFRAEQIQILKDKIASLRTKVDRQKISSVTDNHRNGLNQLESVKRKELEMALISVEKHKKDYAEVKQKNDGLLARINDDENSSKIRCLLESYRMEIVTLTRSKEKAEERLLEQQNINLEQSIENKALLTLENEMKHLESKLPREKSALKRDRSPTRQETATIESLNDTIDMLRDENDALKLSIQTTMASKAQDLQLYGDLLDQTRDMFEKQLNISL